MEEYKPKKRRNWRLPHYDYSSSGAYSITACTRNRKEFFHIEELKALLEEQWHLLPQTYPGTIPDTLVIMPDHIHCLIILEEEREDSRSVIEMIGGYKSLVNMKWIKYAKEKHLDGPWKLWQESCHDHIIRNELDYREKKQYILNNPIAKALKDEENA